jgi:hypothetical protein
MQTEERQGPGPSYGHILGHNFEEICVMKCEREKKRSKEYGEGIERNDLVMVSNIKEKFKYSAAYRM